MFITEDKKKKDGRRHTAVFVGNGLAMGRFGHFFYLADSSNLKKNIFENY